MTTTQEARVDALAFLKRNKLGVLATVSRDRLPHASTIHYLCDDEFNLYFLTQIESRKYDALSAHPEVAFTVSTQDVPQTLQIEGRAMDISHDAAASHKKAEVLKVLNSNEYFYPPLAKLNPSEVAIVWIQPTWMRWADYAFARNGSDNVWRDIPVEH